MVLTTDKNSKWHRKLWFVADFISLELKGATVVNYHLKIDFVITSQKDSMYNVQILTVLH